MLRIPNASPSGPITNFETKCAEYFHPRVLVYILRNKAAYLSRNSYILNTFVKFPLLNHGDRIAEDSHTIHTLKNLNVDHNSNENRSLGPSQKLEDDLMQLSCSLLSCISYVNPQSVSTIMLSFTKLNYYNEQLYLSLLDSFKFESARPKSVSLILYSLSKCSGAPRLINTSFFINLEGFVQMTLTHSSTHDLTAYLISISKLRDKLMRAVGRHCALDSLSNVYSLILNRTVYIIENEKKPPQTEESNVVNQPAPCSFSVFELSNILESFYIMKHFNHTDHGLVLEQLKMKLPYSVNYINDVLYVMDLFNIDAKNQSIKKSDRTNIIRLNRRFSEGILSNLTDNLGLLNIYELSRLTKLINRLRLWTEDDFLRSFTKSFMSIFVNYRGVVSMELLEPILLYYNRRYESSINREYYQSHINKRERPDLMRDLNEVSDLCGYVCDILHDYITKNHPSSKIDDLLKFTSKLRTNRSLHRMKYNYK